MKDQLDRPTFAVFSGQCDSGASSCCYVLDLFLGHSLFISLLVPCLPKPAILVLVRVRRRQLEDSLPPALTGAGQQIFINSLIAGVITSGMKVSGLPCPMRILV